MPRYNLRSSKAVASSPQVSETRARQEVTRTSSSATSSQDELPADKPKVSKSVTSTQIEPPAKKSKVSMCRRRVARRSRKKNSLPRPSSYTIYDLPPGMITSSSYISFSTESHKWFATHIQEASMFKIYSKLQLLC